MPFNASWSPEMKQRYFKLQNTIAERALRRGRKWTADEKLQNLITGLFCIDLRRAREAKLEAEKLLNSTPSTAL